MTRQTIFRHPYGTVMVGTIAGNEHPRQETHSVQIYTLDQLSQRLLYKKIVCVLVKVTFLGQLLVILQPPQPLIAIAPAHSVLQMV